MSPIITAARLVAGATPIHPDQKPTLPKIAGAYLLIARLAEPLSISIGRRPPGTLETGWYAYAGSAYGPGGIRARITRHFRSDKATRWHIDQLTQIASELITVPVPGGKECALLQAMATESGVELSIPHFGSSDCKNCSTHLLQCI
jgi:Uri superfamily endonuclease